MKFNSSSKIGEVVIDVPAAKELFKGYNIDFCCGGNKTIAEATSEININETELLDKLNDLSQKIGKEGEDKNWRTENYTEIIDFILSKHHAYLHRIMPELSELVTKIFRVHGPAHDNLKELHKHFHTLKMELEQHLIREEEELFPLIKAYDVQPSEEILTKILRLIDELEEEHVNAGDILKDMRNVTDNYFIPDDICKTFAYTFTELAKMEADLFEHIHLENNILFPRLELEK